MSQPVILLVEVVEFDRIAEAANRLGLYWLVLDQRPLAWS